jgi:SAM-dependent methyltransferase
MSLPDAKQAWPPFDMDRLERYRTSEQEKARTTDLMRILPRGRRSVLDVGARDGHFSRLLTEYFAEVTALDLSKPHFEIPGVTTLAGNVTNLAFAADSFDCVFCAEVLEHVADVEKACREIARVAKHEVIIGAPFKQDIRIGRSVCHVCGEINPPWGHVNSFDEKGLLVLFSGLQIISKSFVGRTKEATNAVSTFLLDLAGNPWGTYDQDEPCIKCGAKLKAPGSRAIWQKGCSNIASRMNRIQAMFTKPHAVWIHLVFSKI